MIDKIMQMFGTQNFQQRFNQFQQQINQQGINPQQQVQQLLNSGQMSQQQFNQLRAIANALTGKKM